MKKLLILGVTIAAAVALTACGGGGSGATAAGAPKASDGTVSVKSISGAGRVLVDSSGKALYASNLENGSGKVMCTNACNSFWEPLTVGSHAPQGTVAGGKLDVVKRPDGADQLTWNGKLLYSFTQDGPDEVTGDGFQDAFGGKQFTWHVVSVGGASNAAAGGASNSGTGGGGAFSY